MSTENKRTYEELEKENCLLKTVLENVPGYFFVVDKDGKAIIATGDSIDLMGVSVDEIKTIPVEQFKSKAITDDNPATFDALTKGIPMTKYLTSKAGTPILACARPVFENGNLKYVVSFTQKAEIVASTYAEYEKQKNETEQIIDYLSMRNSPPPFIARDSNARAIFNYAAEVAKTDSTIMIYGETGVGKEVLAKYIHQCSTVSNKRFIPVNCAAVPSELLESEFFGYEKGAFTGAKREGRIGLFEMADGGTLFLDEIGELPLGLQSKLLRVLESGEVKRVGGSETINVNVRIIAATNANLKEKINEGKFRKDLYYRLNVIPITIIPLRERKDDIIPLAHFFVDEFNRKYGLQKRLSDKSNTFLLEYEWPGNIRELKNVIERSYVTTHNDLIEIASGYEVDDIYYIGVNNKTENDYQDIDIQSRGLKDVLNDIEEKIIKKAIDDNKGNYTLAAKDLKINRSALYKKIEKYKKND